MSESKGWSYQCEECQELELIKRRCEDYRLQTIELKRKVKEGNIRIDLLEKSNKALSIANVSNVAAAKEDVKRLQRLVNDQKAIIDNFRLMLKLNAIK